MSRAADPGAIRVWTRVSSAAAPVLLVGGWTLAAARQPGDFDAVRLTISALAADGAADRWVMTVGLAGTGLCHLATAAGLRAAAPAGRAVLAVGGAGTVGVAAFPLPADGASVPHTVAAAVAFTAMAAWPLVAGRDRPGEAPLLRRGRSVAAGCGLLALVAWFGAELVTGGDRLGLAERVAAAAQAGWPLLVVATAVTTTRLRSASSSTVT